MIHKPQSWFLCLVLFVLSIKLCMQIYTANKPPTNRITYSLFCFGPLSSIRRVFTQCLSEWESTGGTRQLGLKTLDCIDKSSPHTGLITGWKPCRLWSDWAVFSWISGDQTECDNWLAIIHPWCVVPSKQNISFNKIILTQGHHTSFFQGFQWHLMVLISW